MAKADNKDLIQSYIFTTAKYDFSVMQKRILYRQIEIEQDLLEGNKIKHGVQIDTSLWGNKRYTIPLKSLLSHEDDKNYNQIREAFEGLLTKIITINTKEFTMGFGVIQEYKIEKRGSCVSWVAHPEVVKASMNFSKGYRKYELKTAMKFKSVYAMRMYELLSEQKKPFYRRISTLKEIFGLIQRNKKGDVIKERYKQSKDFFKYVIDPAKRELDKHAPYSFEYKKEKDEGGRKYTKIKFYPTYNPDNRDSRLEALSLKRNISTGWYLTTEEKIYLQENFHFSNKELTNNIDLFQDYKKQGDLLELLTRSKRRILDAKNPKGYIVGMIKRALKNKQISLY